MDDSGTPRLGNQPIESDEEEQNVSTRYCTPIKRILSHLDSLLILKRIFQVIDGGEMEHDPADIAPRQEDEFQPDSDDPEENDFDYAGFDDRPANARDEAERSQRLDRSDSAESSSSGDSSVLENQLVFFENQKLDVILPGTAGNMTVRESLLIDLALFLRHNWSYEALIGVLNSKNFAFDHQYFPSHKRALWKVIDKDKYHLTKHFYCPNVKCLRYLGKWDSLPGEVTCACGSRFPRLKAKYFISVSLAYQIKQLLETPGIVDVLLNRETRTKCRFDSVEDIYDGEEYIKLRNSVEGTQYDLTYVFNTDGFNIMRHAKTKGWPLFVKINELPPNLRQKHMLLAGIWVDTVDPNMATFLKPFVKQSNRLSSTGTSWKKADGTEVISRLFPTCQCMDCVARFHFMNMNGCTGEYASLFCDMKGVYSGGCYRYLIQHPQIPFYSLRDDASLRQDMLSATEQNRMVRGVKGTSYIMLLDHFDLVKGAASDDLHTLFENVAAHHTEFILSYQNELLLGQLQLLMPD